MRAQAWAAPTQTATNTTKLAAVRQTCQGIACQPRRVAAVNEAHRARSGMRCFFDTGAAGETWATVAGAGGGVVLMTGVVV